MKSYEICDVGQLLLWIGLQGATSLHSVHLCAAVLCRCQYCNALNTALSLAAVLSAFFWYWTQIIVLLDFRCQLPWEGQMLLCRPAGCLCSGDNDWFGSGTMQRSVDLHGKFGESGKMKNSAGDWRSCLSAFSCSFAAGGATTCACARNWHPEAVCKSCLKCLHMYVYMYTYMYIYIIYYYIYMYIYIYIYIYTYVYIHKRIHIIHISVISLRFASITAKAHDGCNPWWSGRCCRWRVWGCALRISWTIKALFA